MGVEKKELEERRTKIIELYKKGLTENEIKETMEVSLSTVINALSIAGMRSPKTTEEKLVYADNSIPVLEKVVVDGKLYTDITPIFVPR